MATVKELYNYIKLQIKLGKPVTPFHKAIVEAYEDDEKKSMKEIGAGFIKKDLKKFNQNYKDNNIK